ncbi:hypothetical protein ABZW30_33760 [Kitasatospora sp. NPDC004669]
MNSSRDGHPVWQEARKTGKKAANPMASRLRGGRQVPEEAPR